MAGQRAGGWEYANVILRVGDTRRRGSSARGPRPTDSDRDQGTSALEAMVGDGWQVVQSSAIGPGVYELRLRKPAGTDRGTSTGRPSSAGGAVRPLVLVVEDDPAVASVLVEMLREAGCDSIAAGDGPTALQLARERRPALVMLDLGLPGMHGAAVLQALKADPETSGVPVVIASGTSDGIAHGELAGAIAVIRKPLHVEQVAQLVAYLVDAG